jgi:uncharacterized SAM-binding protein YcdF (DUF218 family)
VRRILPLLLFLGMAAFVVILLDSGAFTTLWKRWLVVSVPMSKADAIIVLGGEPSARPAEAASLYRKGVAPLVFVTGMGDAARNRQLLISSGVSESAVIVEDKASTTDANARFLKPLLEKYHVGTALLVTSPFHTRRALGTFRKEIPGVTFGVVDASITWWNTSKGRPDLNRYAFIELFKTMEYWLLYGVPPWAGSVRPISPG